MDTNNYKLALAYGIHYYIPSMRVFGLLSFTDPPEHLLNCKRLLLLLNVYRS